jgi:signal peptidase II
LARAKHVRQPSLPWWLGLSGAVIVLDQLAKAWIAANFRLGESLPLTSFFDLVFVFNAGAAFNFLRDAGGWQKWFFIVLALGISGWLIVMLRQHARQKLLPMALALILGGALGNVIDRLRFDAVVDFLDFHWAGYHFPAFNVADSAISVGVILMIWHELFRKETAHDRARESR